MVLAVILVLSRNTGYVTCPPRHHHFDLNFKFKFNFRFYKKYILGHKCPASKLSFRMIFFFLSASLSKNSQTLHRTVGEWHKTGASRFTTSLTEHLSDPVSTNTERRGHHKPGIFWWGCPLETVCIQRPTRKDVSPGVQSRKVDPWAMEKVMQSNESSLSLFPFLDRFVLGDLQRIP